jgi:hypothetical protein
MQGDSEAITVVVASLQRRPIDPSGWIKHHAAVGVAAVFVGLDVRCAADVPALDAAAAAMSAAAAAVGLHCVLTRWGTPGTVASPDDAEVTVAVQQEFFRAVHAALISCPWRATAVERVDPPGPTPHQSATHAHPDHWLACLDDDELLYVDQGGCVGAVLATVPQRVPVVNVANWEAVLAEKHAGAAEVPRTDAECSGASGVQGASWDDTACVPADDFGHGDTLAGPTAARARTCPTER